jgi:GNAT superfamily N-acetyltransferase
MGSGMTKLVWTPSSAPVDAAEAARARDALTRLGLRPFTLLEAGRGPRARRALYELVRLGVVDDPGEGTGFVSFERFDAELFGPFYWRWADAQHLAADGARWVGLVNLQLRTAERAEMGITVVRRAYRRRGVARALKVLALGCAQERGVTRVTTWNHVGNIPILRLNASLGFHAP